MYGLNTAATTLAVNWIVSSEADARVQPSPSCGGFADGNTKYLAERGPGSFVNIDDTDPAGRLALRKLKAQDYASAGLVDAGPEKFFVRSGPEGRWCPHCANNTIFHSWTRSLSVLRWRDDPRVRDGPGPSLKGSTCPTGRCAP